MSTMVDIRHLKVNQIYYHLLSLSWNWISFNSTRGGGGSFTRDSERQMKKGSWNRASLSFSLWELCEGKLEGGLLYWGPWRIHEVRFWKRMSFSIEASFWGTWRGYSFARGFKRRMRVFYQENFYWGIQQTFKRRLWKWATLSIGALLGNLWGFCLKGDSLSDRWKRALKMEHLSVWHLWRES